MKIKFDINVNAPKVVVPMSSLRREGFIVDLGNIGISNSFQIIPETAAMETQAILDMLTIALSDLKVYRYMANSYMLLYKGKNLVWEILANHTGKRYWRGKKAIVSAYAK